MELLKILESRLPQFAKPSPPPQAPPKPPPTKLDLFPEEPLPDHGQERFKESLAALEKNIDADPRRERYRCCFEKLKRGADDRAIAWQRHQRGLDCGSVRYRGRPAGEDVTNFIGRPL
jgi:hypothetical protein